MISAQVIHGEGIGAGLGFPTANLDISEECFQVEPGVYAAHVHHEGEEYRGALIVRAQPWKVEVYMFDYIGSELYGKTVIVDPVRRVDDIGTFDSREQLVEKIKKDIELVKVVFKN